MSTQYQKLSDLLKQLFQSNQADLDFGIYRIINQRRTEINRFLDEDLLPQVQTAFSEYQSYDKEVIEEELKEAIESAEKLGVEPDSAPKVQQIRERMATYSVDVSDLENQVYSALYNFFRRYYAEGDFISQRRYKEGVYAIPYEGEEVKLYWANHDQYYIKTSEYFRDYSFKLPTGKHAHFKLVEADTEKDNRKEIDDNKRRFVLAEDPVAWQDGEVVICFEFRPEKPNQSKCNEKSLQTITKLRTELTEQTQKDALTELFHPAPTEGNPNRTLLEKHLEDYTRRNTQDYFIHKDLGKFLRRELDFYIKNEVMHLDNIENESAPRVEEYLSKIKVIRQIAHKIIDFLAQIEDFQKKLWLKKKFVVETNYCITLDRIPEELYPEIASNDAQREEWVRLFAIDEIKRNGKLFKVSYSNPLTVEFIKANLFLVLDTKFFDQEFKYKVLASIEDIDKSLNGLLLQSENFQALQFLSETYRKHMKSIYIDPPYNTDASAILYKNNYKDSSWTSLMESRLQIAHSLLRDEGIICVAIDDEEVLPLRYLLTSVFGNQLGIVPVRSNPAGRKTKGRLAPTHEYALFYGKSPKSIPGSIPKRKKALARYPHQDAKGRFAWANFIRSGNNDKREDRPKLYYPIFVSEENRIRIPQLMWNDEKNEYLIQEKPNKNEMVVFPIVESENGEKIEKNWQRGYVRVPTELDEYRVRREENGKVNIDFKTRMDEGAPPKTWWDYNLYASANYGPAELKNLFGEKIFDYAKSERLVEDCLRTSGLTKNNCSVIDFFAGSGTTGHAVINLNRTDGGNRKYILIEMEQYFDFIVKPRIQKAIYSEGWKDGKPISRKGSSHEFKYIRLESYEDALNNLSLKRSKTTQTALLDETAFSEDYLLHYMLDFESQDSLLDLERFETPFDYQLQIASSTVGETKATPVDLVETFNYLIGLHVQSIHKIEGAVVVRGITRDEKQVLVIWRTVAEMDNDQLNNFFEAHLAGESQEITDIYVNGDNNLANIRPNDQHWTVHLTEESFHRLMFEEG